MESGPRKSEEILERILREKRRMPPVPEPERYAQAGNSNFIKDRDWAILEYVFRKAVGEKKFEFSDAEETSLFIGIDEAHFNRLRKINLHDKKIRADSFAAVDKLNFDNNLRFYASLERILKDLPDGETIWYPITTAVQSNVLAGQAQGHVVTVGITKSAESLNISVCDSFPHDDESEESRESHAAVIGQLIGNGLKKTVVTKAVVGVNQEAADCSLHAVFNSILRKHPELNYQALTPEECSGLRKALDLMNETGSLYILELAVADLLKRKKIFAKATEAEAKDAEQIFQNGQSQELNLDSRDQEQALKNFQRAADLNNVHAMYTYAARIIERAEAEVDLAKKYMKSEGAYVQNNVKTLTSNQSLLQIDHIIENYLEKAAALGHIAAKYKLAFLYAEGKKNYGIQQNPVKAFYYASTLAADLAAKPLDEPFQSRLNNLIETLKKYLTRPSALDHSKRPALEASANTAPVRFQQERVDLRKLPTRDDTDPSSQITIGDLHGNALKFIYFLMKHRVLNLERNDYEELVKIYDDSSSDGRPGQDSPPLTRANFEAFNRIIGNAQINPAATKPNFIVRLIGDEVGDRGANDYFTLKIFQKLRLGKIGVETMLSNHGVEFLEAIEARAKPGHQAFVDFKSELDNYGQVNSLKALQKLVRDGLLTEEDVRSLADENYKSTLKLLSYTLSPDQSKITLYMHADVGLETVKEIARLAGKFDLPYDDSSPQALAATIDAINAKFQTHYVQKNSIKELYNPNLKDRQVTPQRDPIGLLVWHREEACDLVLRTVPPDRDEIVTGRNELNLYMKNGGLVYYIELGGGRSQECKIEGPPDFIGDALKLFDQPLNRERVLKNNTLELPLAAVCRKLIEKTEARGHTRLYQQFAVERPILHPNGYIINYVHGHDGTANDYEDGIVNLNNRLGQFKDYEGHYNVALSPGSTTLPFMPELKDDRPSPRPGTAPHRRGAESGPADEDFPDLTSINIGLGPPVATVTPTLVAEGAGRVIRSRPQPFVRRSSEDLTVAAELENYKTLVMHYSHWSELAKGSWSELENLAQASKSCGILRDRLHDDTTFGSGLTGLAALQQKLDATIQTLVQIHHSGPKQQYLFCDHELKDEQKIQAELKAITGQEPPLDHFASRVAASVSTNEAAFVQGIRRADNAFISEAYVTAALSSSPDKLRDFVLDQIESFHANPNSVGKKIRFQGNFSKEYLIEAINYCNLRGYTWELEAGLKAKVMTALVEPERTAVDDLFRSTPHPLQEAAWKAWLKTNHKTPFSELLDKKTLATQEKTLLIQPLTEAEKLSGKTQVEALLRRAATAPPPLSEHQFQRPGIFNSPSQPLGRFSVSMGDQNVDQPFASITKRPGPNGSVSG